MLNLTILNLILNLNLLNLNSYNYNFLKYRTHLHSLRHFSEPNDKLIIHYKNTLIINSYQIIKELKLNYTLTYLLLNTNTLSNL
jgi:hypothetical protein